MAGKLPRHPFVVDAVTQMLERRRDVVFADKSLTHDGELFFVIKMNRSDYPEDCHKHMVEICVEVVKEDCIQTVDRSVDYLNELRSIGAFRPFIVLFRILTSLKRTHDVVTAA
ncbi:hypothetical protein [Sphingobium yanoikuyae]|jgi:hypothetical protein|uniref:hypothetical protein n=1 Tax=Sphingobium yanoikuyae TaxID=13690 RepID=UPI0028AB9823|nr:hypothetical protein [Sphingobium yanoikuyae]